MRTIVNFAKRLILHLLLFFKAMILNYAFSLFLVDVTQRMYPLDGLFVTFLGVVLAELLDVAVLKRVNVFAFHGKERLGVGLL